MKVSRGKIVVTGGLGFIGSNVVPALVADGWQVIVFDNLQRAMVERNLAKFEHNPNIEVVRGDVRMISDWRKLSEPAVAVVHLAGNSGIPWSLHDPVRDFEENVVGTLNALEWAEAHGAGFIFGSTNRVYPTNVGEPHIERHDHYHSEWAGVHEGHVSLSGPRSPYGASKLAADIYCQEWFHFKGVPTIVNRMGVIYGPGQYGVTEQGWVGFFCRMAHEGKPITIYGNGKQVRDPLYVGDLVRLIRYELEHMPELAGEVFNVGGGPTGAVSLLQAVEKIGVEVESFQPVRLLDMNWYVTDHHKVSQRTGWKPSTSFDMGVDKLMAWLVEDMPRNK